MTDILTPDERGTVECIRAGFAHCEKCKRGLCAFCYDRTELLKVLDRLAPKPSCGCYKCRRGRLRAAYEEAYAEAARDGYLERRTHDSSHDHDGEIT